MSYIFEALKKAEQERHQGHVSHLETTLVFSKDEKTTVKWGWLIGIVAGVNGLLLGFFLLWTYQQHPTPFPSAQQPSIPPSSTLSSPTPSRHLAETSVLSEHSLISIPKKTPVIPTKNEVIEEKTVPKPIKTSKASGSKPVPARINLPHLEINVHVYDKNPQHRFVLLNGKRYKEGMYIQSDMKLKAIRTDGVLIEYQGTEIFISRP